MCSSLNAEGDARHQYQGMFLEYIFFCFLNEIVCFYEKKKKQPYMFIDDLTLLVNESVVISVNYGES